MKELVLVIRPEKLETVKAILDKEGCGGMTISNVMGCGAQKGFADEEVITEIRGFKTTINLLPKIKVEVVVSDDKIDDIIADVREKVASEHVGDGKIFVRNIEMAMRIRTGERDEKAL